jgi:type IV pilus assembly protein PilE
MAPARRDPGVTLLELLVALALAGVLAALAYPSYRAALLRAHRVEAIDALLGVAAAQERFHIQHGRYASRLDDGSDALEPVLTISAVTAGGRYRLALAGSGLNDFTATAAQLEGSGQDADERCSLFSIRANGQRAARDRRGADTTGLCWG